MPLYGQDIEINQGEIIMKSDQDVGIEAADLPVVAVIILNWNGWLDTLACLETVYELKYPEYLTIVVDNGSTDDSVREIRQWAHNRNSNDFVIREYLECEVRDCISDKDIFLDAVKSDNRMVLIISAHNLGFADGNNLAIQYALNRSEPADYVLLLNNDTKIEEDCIDHLVTIARKTDSGIVGALIKDYDSDNIQFAGNMATRYSYLAELFRPLSRVFLKRPDLANEYWQCSWVTGAGMLISDKFLRHLYSLEKRYFDSAFYLYCEDVEICFYAWRLGYKSIVARDAVIHHATAKSSGGIYNPVSYYYQNRNAFYLGNRYAPVMLKPLFNVYLALIVLIRAIKNIIYGRNSSASAILKGYFDAIRNITGRWRKR
jgi:GT2 family glycosyltransferase